MSDKTKTAEENKTLIFLNKYCDEFIPKKGEDGFYIPYYAHDSVIKAMEAYAAQALAEREEEVKRLKAELERLRLSEAWMKDFTKLLKAGVFVQINKFNWDSWFANIEFAGKRVNTKSYPNHHDAMLAGIEKGKKLLPAPPKEHGKDS
jgi:hypothetical protein